MEPVTYNFTINPTPSDATVIIKDLSGTVLASGTGSQTVRVQEGTKIIWNVSKTNCIEDTNKDNPLVINSDIMKDIILKTTFTVNSIPNTAAVEIKNLSGDVLASGLGTATVTLPVETEVIWNVSKIGYIPQDGNATLGDSSITVTLQVKTVKFEIIPRVDGVVVTDAIIKMNGVEQSYVQVQEGTTVSYSVSKTYYVTQSGQTSATESPLYIDLEPKMVNFAIKSNPSNATIVINGKTVKSEEKVQVPAGSTVNWKAHADWYKLDTGTHTMGENDVTLTRNLAENIQYTPIAASRVSASSGFIDVNDGADPEYEWEHTKFLNYAEFSTDDKGVTASYTWYFSPESFRAFSTENRIIRSIEPVYVMDVRKKPDIKSEAKIGSTVCAYDNFSQLSVGMRVFKFRLNTVETNDYSNTRSVPETTWLSDNITLDLLRANDSSMTITMTSTQEKSWLTNTFIHLYGGCFLIEYLEKGSIETAEVAEVSEE